MDKRRTVESRIRRKDLQGKQYGDRYGTRSSIFRSSPSQVSSPTSSQLSSQASSQESPQASSQKSSPPSPLIRSISSVQVAHRLAQFKQMPAQVSCSIVRHPYAWLGATWLGLVLIGSIATVVLLRIDPTNPEPLIAVSPVEHSVSTVLPDEDQLLPSQENLSQDDLSQTDLLSPTDLNAGQTDPSLPEPHSIQKARGSSLPLFALGTVAFSCAIGCLLLSYRFGSHVPKAQSRLPARSQRIPRPAPPSFPKVSPKVTAPKVVAKHGEATKTESHSSSAEASAGGTIAIVSPDESHPLDWDEPSLADKLDIRQRHPLSHWL